MEGVGEAAREAREAGRRAQRADEEGERRRVERQQQRRGEQAAGNGGERERVHGGRTRARDHGPPIACCRRAVTANIASMPRQQMSRYGASVTPAARPAERWCVSLSPIPVSTTNHTTPTMDPQAGTASRTSRADAGAQAEKAA